MRGPPHVPVTHPRHSTPSRRPPLLLLFPAPVSAFRFPPFRLRPGGPRRTSRFPSFSLVGYGGQAAFPRAFLFLLLLLTGCFSASIRAPIDLTGPDWTRREGQAVWQAERHAAGVAGDLLVATHPDGRSLIQFIKPPLPFVTAQR